MQYTREFIDGSAKYKIEVINPKGTDTYRVYFYRMQNPDEENECQKIITYFGGIGELQSFDRVLSRVVLDIEKLKEHIEGLKNWDSQSTGE